MNNYIDERIIPYKRTRTAAKRYVRAEMGRPLTRKTRNDGIVVRGLRVLAAIFLLLLSTFGGDEADRRERMGASVEKAIKSCLLWGGILLALWGVLVAVGNIVNAVTFLPTWSLILMFAIVVLVAAGGFKK